MLTRSEYLQRAKVCAEKVAASTTDEERQNGPSCPRRGRN